MDELFRLDGVSKSFGGLQALKRVRLSVEEGELSSIIGPNGAGKTTLFHLITGYHKPDEGRIVFNGKEITGMKPAYIVREEIGRAFQRINIFPRLTVLENVTTAILSYERRCGTSSPP